MGKDNLLSFLQVLRQNSSFPIVTCLLHPLHFPFLLLQFSLFFLSLPPFQILQNEKKTVISCNFLGVIHTKYFAMLGP